MSEKHTPGPWRTNGFQIEGPNMGLVIATATAPRIGWAPKTKEEGLANARLIASAPDLLAAAKKALNFIHSLPYEPSMAPSTKLQDALVDAINKATKEQE